MSSDSIPTIDIASASAPPVEAPTLQVPSPEPPPEPAVPPTQARPARPRWLDGAARLGVFALCFGLVALLQARGLAWSASATGWLEGVPRPGGVAEVGATAVLWRRGAALGLSLGHVVSIWQFSLAGSLLAGLLLVAWRLRGLAAAAIALGMFLLWPTSRSLLTTVGAETPLAAALLFGVQAGLLAWPRPLVSALLLGTAVAALVLVHPLGLPLGIVLTLAVLILPLRRGVEPLPGVEPHEGLWPHAVTVPNLTGLALAAALVAAAHGHGGLKIAWTRQIAEWRAPVVTPWLGGMAQWPLLGPITAWATQTSLPILMLASSAAVGAARRPTDPTALASATVFGTWLALTWLGLPTPGAVDAVALLAPGLVLLAAVMTVDVAREVWARGTTGARSGGVVLVLATLLAFLADQRLAANDRRNLLGHIPGVVVTVVATQPAILRPADVGLLYQRPVATTILPGHIGGNSLAMALRQLHPPLQAVSFGSAFASELVLVSARPGSPIEEMWTQIGKQQACSADGETCLVRIRTK